MQIVLIVLGLVLIVAGLFFAIRGFGEDGQSSAGGQGFQFSGPPWLILVVIGVGLIVFSAIWNFDGGDEDDEPSEETTDATTDFTTDVTTAPTTATTAPSGCRITIANQLATISETPDVFGQEIMRVPAGDYPVLEVTTTNFVQQSQRWFRIEVSGRQGWIQDTAFNVASKSADCP